MKNQSDPRTLPRAAVIFGLVLFTSCLVQAAIITQTVDGGGSSDNWNDALWGSPAAVPTAGNDYVMADFGAGIDLRILDNAGNTFAGDSLTVVSDTVLIMKQENNPTATINGNLILDGGRLLHGPNSVTSSTFDATQFVVNSSSSIAAGINSSRIPN